MSQKFSIKKRLKSFKYAFNGLRILLKEEHNSRIHIAVALIVSILGFIFKISPVEWVSLVITIGLVIVMEIVNSAIENLCDFVSPEKNYIIKKVKDLSAAAVLLSAIVAIVVGVIIFGERVINSINTFYNMN